METFTITRTLSTPNIGRGSEIRLFLKEDQLEYLEGEEDQGHRQEGTPEFISYPIQLAVTKEVEKVSRHSLSDRLSPILNAYIVGG